MYISLNIDNVLWKKCEESPHKDCRIIAKSVVFRTEKRSGSMKVPERQQSVFFRGSEFQILRQGIVVLYPVVDIDHTVFRSRVPDDYLLYPSVDDELAAHHAG